MASYGETITIPSPIDVHVHLREPGGTESETIQTGTAAARDGGYQAVIDMPNNPGGNETWTEERVDEKTQIASLSASTDIGFYGGVDFDNPAFSEIKGMMPKVMGTKFYMGFTTGNAQERTLDDVREYANAWIYTARELGLWSPILLHAREKIGAETAEYILEQDHPVHWCHISTVEEARLASRLQSQYPALFTSEVTLHHLTMTERNAEFQQSWNGARMQPPLGKEIDAQELLFHYNRGDIPILATDHAPHTRDRKMDAEAENPQGVNEPDCTTCYGVTGIEFVLPVMLRLVQTGKVRMERLVDSLHHQPKKMLGIHPNAVETSATTDVQLEAYVIGESDAKSRSRNTPYIGWTAAGSVVSVNWPNQDIGHVYKAQLRRR